MLPKAVIKIAPDGTKVKIEGKEKSDNCFELSELGKRAGKVVEDKDKDHVPVHQDVHHSERG